MLGASYTKKAWYILWPTHNFRAQYAVAVPLSVSVRGRMFTCLANPIAQPFSLPFPRRSIAVVTLPFSLVFYLLCPFVAHLYFQASSIRGHRPHPLPAPAPGVILSLPFRHPEGSASPLLVKKHPISSTSLLLMLADNVFFSLCCCCRFRCICRCCCCR